MGARRPGILIQSLCCLICIQLIFGADLGKSCSISLVLSWFLNCMCRFCRLVLEVVIECVYSFVLMLGLLSV